MSDFFSKIEKFLEIRYLRVSEWISRRLPRQKLTATADWVDHHQYTLGFLWWLVLLTLVAIDIYMRMMLQVESISARIWDLTATHPTLILFGCMLGACVCYLERSWRVILVFTGIAIGHLFGHE